MALPPEQIKQIKAQLKQQVESQNLPEDEKQTALKQVEDMSPDAVELLLKQQSTQPGGGGDGQQVFRSILSGEIPSKKIDENSFCIAVLDIKPISKGHTVVIPKTPITSTKDLPNQVFSLAKKLSKKICSKLKAQSTEIQTQFAFGEIVINIIPIYDKSLNINSPRSEVSDDELNKVFNKLKKIEKPKTIKIKKPKQKTPLYLPRKIP